MQVRAQVADMGPHTCSCSGAFESDPDELAVTHRSRVARLRVAVQAFRAGQRYRRGQGFTRYESLVRAHRFLRGGSAGDGEVDPVGHAEVSSTAGLLHRSYHVAGQSLSREF